MNLHRRLLKYPIILQYAVFTGICLILSKMLYIVPLFHYVFVTNKLFRKQRLYICIFALANTKEGLLTIDTISTAFELLKPLKHTDANDVRLIEMRSQIERHILRFSGLAILSKYGVDNRMLYLCAVTCTRIP